MSPIHYIKHHPCVELAHIYEHIFMGAIHEMFNEHGLYPYIDYACHGTTWERGGLIDIEFTPYNTNSEITAASIPNLELNITEGCVQNAVLQIQAESNGALCLTCDTYAPLMQHLEALHTQNWQTSENVNIINMRNVRRRHTPATLSDPYPETITKCSLELTVDPNYGKQRPELLPLFYYIARALIESGIRCNNRLYSWYYDDIATQEYSVKASLKVAKRYVNSSYFELDAVSAQLFKTITEVIEKKGLERLMEELKKPLNHSYNFPDQDTTFGQCGVYLGQKAWDDITTKSNATEILKHTTLTLKRGRSRATVPLSSITIV